MLKYSENRPEQRGVEANAAAIWLDRCRKKREKLNRRRREAEQFARRQRMAMGIMDEPSDFD